MRHLLARGLHGGGAERGARALLTRTRFEDGQHLPVLVWRLDPPLWSIASAPLGGGIGARNWVVNASVADAYDRRDPDRHLAELAHGFGLSGPGVGFLTAVDVARPAIATDDGVEVVATVGLRDPVWAAAPDTAGPPGTGTINIVAFLPERLGDAALVNAVGTAVEAKAQALWDLGVSATGTVTDAVCLLCPARGAPHAYGGPRSRWGAPLARAVHRAVLDGAAMWRD